MQEHPVQRAEQIRGTRHPARTIHDALELVEEDPGIVGKAIPGASRVADEGIHELREAAWSVLCEHQGGKLEHGSHFPDLLADHTAALHQPHAGIELIPLPPAALALNAAQAYPEHPSHGLDPFRIPAHPIELLRDAAGHLGGDSQMIPRNGAVDIGSTRSRSRPRDPDILGETLMIRP